MKQFKIYAENIIDAKTEEEAIDIVREIVSDGGLRFGVECIFWDGKN